MLPDRRFDSGLQASERVLSLQIQLAQVATVYQITVYLNFNGADTVLICFEC